MKKTIKLSFKNSITALLALGTVTPLCAAPLWIFKPQTPTALSLSPGDTTTVRYLVTSQSRDPQQLKMLNLPGITPPQQCNLAPAGQPGDSCIIELSINGSALPRAGILGGPDLCQIDEYGEADENQCYHPGPNDILKLAASNSSLSVSSNAMTLATQGIFTEQSGINQATCINSGGTWNAAGSFCVSRSRTLVITNIGTTTAYNISYTISPSLPSGTTITPSSCGNIPVGGQCELVITPGTTPTAAPDSIPTPSVLTLRSDGLPTLVSSSITVLTYGNRVQGGFVFSIDDTTALREPVGGKVFAFADETQAFWSTNVITSTTAVSISDGVSNTEILTPDNEYPAAATCRNKSSEGFNNWYLPAICEFSYYPGVTNDPGCGTPGMPLIQNGASNLRDLAPSIGGFLTNYWTSTDGTDFFAPNLAWVVRFGPLYDMDGAVKNTNGRIRCARTFG